MEIARLAIEKSSALDPLAAITSGSWPGLIWNTAFPFRPRACHLRRWNQRVVAGPATRLLAPGPATSKSSAEPARSVASPP